MKEIFDTKAERKKNQESRRVFWEQVISFLCLEYDYEFDVINPAHFRLYREEKVIDIFPVGMRFHRLYNDKRGNVEDVEKFIMEEFKPDAKVRGLRARESKRKENEWFRKTILFGKHKGTKFCEIPKEYLQFIYENRYGNDAFIKFLEENEDKFL